jgi:hypothetical protein
VNRLLVIDESTSNRTATELRKRGRPALSVKQMGLLGTDDDVLITTISERHPTAVLVTPDDKLPGVWAEVLAQTGLTVATVDPRAKPPELNTDQWRRDVTHRWAHVMQRQSAGSIRRYGEANRKWTKPRRAKLG